MLKTTSSLLMALCATLTFAFAGVASAQTTAPVAGQLPSQAADPALYKALGERAGIDKLTDDFVQRLVADARMKPFFEKANQANLKKQLADQFCMVSGGPCTYKGVDMKNAHSSMDITKGNFNALVEVLQESMTAQGIAFRAQNQLLAQLAPMHRDVITVK